ncbi:ParB/RepB/Spo0J family partition protein [Candidatus Parcubacteria bacterium]|nr:ParB/RepB/Spo0J family partition protein [Candidatus Parcubacteria bacterium]
MSQFFNNAIFWVEVEKIKPNPFQPRKEFDEAKLADLAKSIRQYGVIQPLTVSRKEVQKPDGGIASEYELIAGERRLRASKLAGVREVPVLIRESFDDDKTKLELAIIENLQREDLNPIDRARAFAQLANEFGFKHTEIAEKIGKSREYVSNTIRLLMLPDEMQQGLSDGKIAEGHTRPLLMLIDKPQEQLTLYKEIMIRRLTVRDAESIARRIAVDKVRKKEYIYSPEVLEMERSLGEVLGTRVAIEGKESGGKLTIDFFGEEDLRGIFARLQSASSNQQHPSAGGSTSSGGGLSSDGETTSADLSADKSAYPTEESATAALDDRSAEEKKEENFDPANFSI